MHPHGNNRIKSGNLANSPRGGRSANLRIVPGGIRRGQEEIEMPTLSLFVRLEAKPGKEADVAAFLMTGAGARTTGGDDARLVRATDRPVNVWRLRRLR